MFDFEFFRITLAYVFGSSPNSTYYEYGMGLKNLICVFQYTRRSAAEVAAEKTFNKLTIKGKKLSIRWGKSQGKQEALTGPILAIPQVPGLPGALPAPPEELRNNFFNLGEGSAPATVAPAAVPYFIPTAALPMPGPGAIHYPSQDPSRMGATQRQIQQ